jgi:uncharacterized protein YcbK (DUF882 family)
VFLGRIDGTATSVQRDLEIPAIVNVIQRCGIWDLSWDVPARVRTLKGPDLAGSLQQSPTAHRLRGRTVPTLRAGMTSIICLILASCTASAPLKSPSLSNLLTPDAQTSTAPPSQQTEETGAAQDGKQTAAATKAPLAAQTENQAVASSRPPGVPKLRPASTSLAPAIEHALVPSKKPLTASQTVAEQLAKGSAAVTSAPDPAPAPSAPAAPDVKTDSASAEAKPEIPKKKSNNLFSNLFQSSQTTQAKPSTPRTGVKKTTSKKRPSRAKRSNWTSAALPGVRGNEIFGINIDENHELDDGVQLASVTNRARRGTHGLLLQREGVKVGCFPPELVRLLKQVERRFGRTPIVTSGYRSRKHNRKIRGARNSMHIHCKAADIQVQGVSKTKLAKYLRSLRGRGGVGTYCSTRSVHIDVGKKRDWNRRCRRRRSRKT